MARWLREVLVLRTQVLELRFRLPISDFFPIHYTLSTPHYSYAINASSSLPELI